MDNLLSIIVAIYQVAPFLRECLESICNQSYKNMEVILVDDGSDDGSGEICDEYEKIDSRFHVIHQENQGVACARKNGVEAAKGQYVGFVDGDDWIAADMYEQLMRPMVEENADVAIVLQNVYHEKPSYCYTEDKVAEAGIYKKENGMNQICQYLFWGKEGRKEGISISLVDKLFRRSQILRYMENVDTRLRYCEDSVCVIPYLMDAEVVYIINRPLYYYRQREGSACHSTDIMYLEQFNIFYQSIINRLSPEKENFKRRLDKYFVSRVYEGLNKMMNLSLKDVLPLYVPPVNKFAEDDKVVIYGAGVVGRDYHRMMELMCPKRVVGWVDKQWEKLHNQGITVEAVSRLEEWEYDRILIAVLFEDSARQIAEELMKQGIGQEKIFWCSPRTILD